MRRLYYYITNIYQKHLCDTCFSSGSRGCSRPGCGKRSYRGHGVQHSAGHGPQSQGWCIESFGEECSMHFTTLVFSETNAWPNWLLHDSWCWNLFFPLCCQASVDHISTGLKSTTQTALARRLLLRQLRATLCKGQMVFLQPWIIAVRFPADSWRLALCFAGQWSRPGEVCCVLSSDQPSTERITCFLPVPSDSSTALEWNEEISL